MTSSSYELSLWRPWVPLWHDPRGVSTLQSVWSKFKAENLPPTSTQKVAAIPGWFRKSRFHLGLAISILACFIESLKRGARSTSLPGNACVPGSRMLDLKEWGTSTKSIWFWISLLGKTHVAKQDTLCRNKVFTRTKPRLLAASNSLVAQALVVPRPKCPTVSDHCSKASGPTFAFKSLTMVTRSVLEMPRTVFVSCS